MTLNRFIFILIALSPLGACANNPITDAPKPSLTSKQQENSIDETKHLELKAFLNKNGTVTLHINNHSTRNVDNILVALRLRYSARIVSNMLFKVPQGIKAGQSLITDTEIPLPTEKSIIRAEVLKATIAP